MARRAEGAIDSTFVPCNARLGFPGDKVTPAMTRRRKPERLMEPRTLFRGKMREHGSEIVIVFRCGRFRLVEQDNLGCEIGNALRARECRHKRPADAVVAAKQPLLHRPVVVVQQELEMVAVGPRCMDLMHWRLKVFVDRPRAKLMRDDFLRPIDGQPGSDVLLVGAQDGHVDIGVRAGFALEE